MNVEAVSVQNTVQAKFDRGAEQAKDAAKKAEDQAASEKVEKKEVQPEEVLQQIKALTEGGVYSVRFENDDEADALVVKVVDPETDEVIRQIPPEELLGLTKRLTELRGNIVDTQS